MISATGAKCTLLILTIGATSAQLLSFRQSRIVTASEMTDSMRRRAELDRSVMAIRLEIARRTTPEHIATMLETLPLNHVQMEWAPPPLTPLFVDVDETDEVLP